MAALVFHPKTRLQLDSLLSNPSHAVLLHGQPGIGKYSLARFIAAEALSINPDQLAKHPYVRIIDSSTEKSTAIDTVRNLEHFLSLKVPSNDTISRIVIVAEAQLLSIEAQNALLKTIEEPPVATMLILTAPSSRAVLPTISSRVQLLQVVKPAAENLRRHFSDQSFEMADIVRAEAISGGLPGLMEALLQASDHPLQPATETARQLLQSSVYARLLLVDGLSKQKDHLLNVLFILQQMAHARLLTTAGSQFEQWQRILKASYRANEQLTANAQPKLVLDALMLNLK